MSNIALKSAEPASLSTVVVTSGEPAGIGPDICLILSQHVFPARIVVLGDRDLLNARAEQLGVSLGDLEIDHVPLRASGKAGVLVAENAAYVLEMLDRAIAGCRSGEYAAMVTAP